MKLASFYRAYQRAEEAAGRLPLAYHEWIPIHRAATGQKAATIIVFPAGNPSTAASRSEATRARGRNSHTLDRAVGRSSSFRAASLWVASLLLRTAIRPVEFLLRSLRIALEKNRLRADRVRPIETRRAGEGRAHDKFPLGLQGSSWGGSVSKTVDRHKGGQAG